MRALPPKIDPDELARLAAQGMSAQRLAVRYRRSLASMLAFAKRAGIPLKTPTQLKAEARRILKASA